RFLQDRYRGLYYGLAQNLAHRLRAAYEDVLRTVDLLVMPTVPITAPSVHGGMGTVWENLRALTMRNTSPFSLTGLPALTLPCGELDGLPVGLTLVGRRSEDHLVLRAGYALEQALCTEVQATSGAN